MHTPAKYTYCGLTILTSPSRFDFGVKELITGQAREYLETCLHPHSLGSCEVIDPESFSGFRSGTIACLILGEKAFEFAGLSKTSSLDSLRGYPLTFQNIPTIVSFHHQDAMDRKNWESDNEESSTDNAESDSEVKNKTKTKRKNYKWWLYHDIKKVCQLIKTKGEIPKDGEWTVNISPEINDLNSLLKTLENEQIVCDIETTRNFTLTCLGIGILRTKTCYVVPWKRYNQVLHYSETECREFIRSLIVAFARNKIILHNAMFDLFILAWKYKVLPPKDVFDTMLAWHRLRPECEKSLGHLISYFLWAKYHKDEGIFEPKSQAQDFQLWEYNSKDIIRTGNIYEKILPEITKYKAEESVRLANREIPTYLSISLFGSKMDLAKRRDRIQDFYKKQEALDRALSHVCRQELNPRSSQQVSEYLYTKLNLPCPNDEEPTKEITLRKLQLAHNIPSLNLILTSRGCRKNASSLDFNAWGVNNDRMTCSWVLAGPDTYRLGSRTILKRKNIKKSGYGTNFQNWNKGNRDLILADENKDLIQVDQAGAEALIVAWLCKRGKFRLLFDLGIKCHVFVALHLFKDKWAEKLGGDGKLINDLITTPIEKLKSNPEFGRVVELIKDSDNWSAFERYYFIAKMVCHSSNYGIGWPTLRNHILDKSEGQVVLSVQDAKKFLNHYHFLFPEIRHWHIDIQSELKLGRKLVNLFGHPRQFNESWGDSLFKQAYAFKPQSTVGQITNYAMCELFEWIESYEELSRGVDLLQNGHDSILCQSPEGNSLEVARKVKSHIERDLISPKGEKFKMKAEVQIGKNWKPFHKDKNPLGLREIKI